MAFVPGEAGPWPRVGPGINDVHFGFSFLSIMFASVHFFSVTITIIIIIGCIIMEFCGSRPSVTDTGLTLMHE